MQVKWANVVAVGFLVAALVILVRTPHEMGAFLSAMKDIHGGTPEEKTIGLLALSIVGLLIVAVIKIIIEGDRRD